MPQARNEAQDATQAGAQDAVLAGFAAPPDAYRPLPFWWWTGEPLDEARLVWQLDRLHEGGVRSAVISYNHDADGRPEKGDPPVFSDAWWSLLARILDHCAARGMTLGVQDYTLTGPLLEEIAQAEPALRGAELRDVSTTVAEGQTARLALPDGCRMLEVQAFDATGDAVDLSAFLDDGVLTWTAPQGEWRVVLVFTRPAPFDPLHPLSGPRMIERFFQPFEDRLGDRVGRTLSVFFQDELDFGARWPFWSDGLVAEFERETGGPLIGRLAHLTHDLGPASVKVRLDFARVAVALLERSWFRPIHEWTESRGCLFGHDNMGRGTIGVGRGAYGDYFQAMRWYSAPGSDDPDLNGPRAFKGLKVASSIAHLYDRPRVWAECFHSSGWGATPAQIVDGYNAVLALGATVLNLHGLYYTTRASWWEWAPPDFHWRQPYWRGFSALQDYGARLSFLLSQGRHVCDVAILYPSAALDGGLNGRVDPRMAGDGNLSESQSGHPPEAIDAAEAAAFQAASALYGAAMDFDFVDDRSVAAAGIVGEALALAGGRYRALVLPLMTTMRWDTLVAVLRFATAGGRVVVLGDPPRASDRAGAADPVLDAAVTRLLAQPGVIRADGLDAATLERIVTPTERDIVADAGGLHVLHRRIETRDVWFVRNAEPVARTVRLSLRAQGGVEQWDARTGARRPLASRAEGGRTVVSVDLSASEAIVVAVDRTAPPAAAHPHAEGFDRVIALPEADWRYEILPTLDNRWGDFAHPAGAEPMGPVVRRFDWTEDDPGDAGGRWRRIAPGEAPRLRICGPLPPEAADPDALGGQTWSDYDFSLTRGLIEDPFLQDWASGPHGLKGQVPDEFIDLDGAPPRHVWWLTTRLHVDASGPVDLAAGGRCAYTVWLDGEVVLDQAEALAPGLRSQWNLPHYDGPRRRHRFVPRPGGHVLLIRVVQPADQRARLYVAVEPEGEPSSLDLRWFQPPGRQTFDVAAPVRDQHYRFDVPPGCRRLFVPHFGAAQAWLGEAPMTGEAAVGGTVFAAAPGTEAWAGSCRVRIAAPPGVRAGDALNGPVVLHDLSGPALLGDWSSWGLADYSGAVRYVVSFVLDDADAAGAVTLRFTAALAMAEIRVNGVTAGILLSPPWALDLGDTVRSGRNRLEIIVYNTLANHYLHASPTPYVREGQTRSGLFGPVEIVVSAR